MAGLAVGFEAATMRVRVTRRALLEGQSDIPGSLLLGAQRLVILLAGYPDVNSNKRKFGFRVVESGRPLPLDQRVTSQTVFSQLAAVLVSMTGEAFTRQAKEGAVQIFLLDGGPFGLGNIAGFVALLTRKVRVLALEPISRLAMVKGLLRRFPMDQEKILTVVLGMAGNTVLVRARRADDRGMISAPQGEPVGDVRVTLRAAEDPRASREFVTRRALERAAQRLVRPGKRAGGDLRRDALGT